MAVHFVTLAALIACSVPDRLPNTNTHPFPTPNDAVVIHTRHFKFPVEIDPARRGQIKETRLWMSRDQGATWKRSGAITPNEGFIPFHAPEDGLYWFAVQVIDMDGTTRPREVEAIHVSQKVLVQTTAVSKSRQPGGVAPEPR